MDNACIRQPSLARWVLTIWLYPARRIDASENAEFRASVHLVLALVTRNIVDTVIDGHYFTIPAWHQPIQTDPFIDQPVDNRFCPAL